MDGILVIDKPSGPTSHDVVDAVRTVLGQKKVGHTGTLDPVATGVLPLVLGRATKIAQFITGGEKGYHAIFRLGVTTKTLDAEGELVAENPVDVSLAQVEEVLKKFVGEIDQIPPMYSAKKIGGKKLYELARKGIEVEREPKRVIVHSIELLSFNSPDIEVDVRCSVGTYVRVLAADVGELLGCGAHLKSLRRTVAGVFSLDDALSLEELEANPESAKERVLPMGRALSFLARIDLPGHLAQMVASGHQLSVADLKTLDLPEYQVEDAVVLFLDNGELLAVCHALIASQEVASSRPDKRALKTDRVLGRVPR